MSKIIIRVQSPDGTKRIELSKDTVATLYEKVLKEFNIDPSLKNEWCLYNDRNRKEQIPITKTPVGEVISHGDMIFLLPSLNGKVNEQEALEKLEEDEVDVYLAKQDGKITRSKDEQLCHHGPQGKCINCIPLEPYDLEYLNTRNPPVKYMSFHAYIKKLQSGADKGKYTNLETLNCKIKPGCKEHPPWPKGICNKCQPPTVYLNRQPYRHVDNIMFENSQIVDKFLNFWRTSGLQRSGLLFGRYEAYEGVPLGIRAVVSAIYEPPQTNYESKIELHLDDPNEAKVKAMAKKLGLKCIGWIFTDLVPEDPRKGTVKHFRGNSQTYFLSSDECITAAYLQNKHRNFSKYSSSGYFGSKFVTVVVTGDSTHHIHFEGYQVSNQCVSLVSDGCLIPTYDAPELAYIRESSNEKYIPDVYFREKDNYNNEVTKIARPLPVEYLIVDLPAAFAKDPAYTFNENSNLIKISFPIENRAQLNEMQDFNSLNNYLKQFPNEKFLEAMSDFHLLVFLATNQTFPLDKSLDCLIESIKKKDSIKAIEWSRSTDWLTIEHFFQGGSEVGIEWSCQACTYHNDSSSTECSICGTPRIK